MYTKFISKKQTKFLIVIVGVCLISGLIFIAQVLAYAVGGNSLPGSSGFNSGGGLSDPTTYNGYSQGTYNTYSQNSYYGQSSYGGGYGQSTYNSYSQGVYNSYRQGSYMSGSASKTSPPFRCPDGQTETGHENCCPDADVVMVEKTNDKGGTYEDATCSPSTEDSSSGDSTGGDSTTDSSSTGNTTSYSQSSYAPPTPAGPPSGMSITADPVIVRFGESSTITWDGGNADTCTVTGRDIEPANANLLSGSQLVANFQSELIYTLTCTLGSETGVETAIVKVLPRIQET